MESGVIVQIVICFIFSLKVFGVFVHWNFYICWVLLQMENTIQLSYSGRLLTDWQRWHLDRRQYLINLRDVKMWKYRFVTLPFPANPQHWGSTCIVINLHIFKTNISIKHLGSVHYFCEFVRKFWMNNHHVGDLPDDQLYLQGVGKLKKNPEELGRIVKNHLVCIIYDIWLYPTYIVYDHDDVRCAVLCTRPTLLTTWSAQVPLKQN